MRLETTLLDKFVQGALMGKRQIGRPLKYNIRDRRHQGWWELIYTPRNNWEKMAGQIVRTVQPYLAFITYRFHVERARDAGMRIEDMYENKFYKEPYVLNHLYAQYFHPNTLLERVRMTIAYRRPRTIFKGIRVPDWAQAQNRGGFEMDLYSRQAWENARHDLLSEHTPMQFAGNRLDPNPLNWARIEQWGKGRGSRLFYNEVPQVNWYRHGSHLGDKERELYSFATADQDRPLVFGIDTTTPEGKVAYEQEWERLSMMAPEFFQKDNIVYPHEVPDRVSTEPHFQRIWKLYRQHVFTKAVFALVENGDIAQDDAQKFAQFINLHNNPSVTLYLLTDSGKLSHLAGDDGFEAAKRVMKALYLDELQIDYHNTSEPYEDQFWKQFDLVFGLNEANLRAELPAIVVDERNKAKVEAVLEGRDREAIGGESSARIGA